MTDASRLRALAEAATPGRWDHDAGNVVLDDRYQVCCGRGTMECCGDPEIAGNVHLLAETSPHDAAYIAAANPQTVIALLDRIERLEKALRPFAKAGELFEPRGDTYDMLVYAPAAGSEYHITGDDLRAARAALEDKGAG